MCVVCSIHSHVSSGLISRTVTSSTIDKLLGTTSLVGLFFIVSGHVASGTTDPCISSIFLIDTNYHSKESLC